MHDETETLPSTEEAEAAGGEVRIVRSNDVPISDVVGVMVRCYFHSEPWVYVFADDASRPASLEWVLERHVNLLAFWEKDTVFYLYTTTEAPELASVASLTLVGPDRTSSVTLMAQASQGLMLAPLALGIYACARLVALQSVQNTCKIQDTCGMQEGYWHLQDIATEPAFQHRGITTALVKRVVHDALAIRALPIYVNMMSERGVRLFQKLGFDIVNIQPVPDTSITNWSMVFTPSPFPQN